MRVIQIGNFRPEHSTENHLLRALRNNGHEVLAMQEDDPSTFLMLGSAEPLEWVPDFVLWTRTGWDWDRNGFPGGRAGALAAQHRMLRRFRDTEIMVFGYHLDIWFGLPRSVQVDDEPFFHVDLLITADGGHEDEWSRRGIPHVWMPPAVSRDECALGMFRDEFRSPLAFVGSWEGGYHPEHQHRFQLVNWLQQNFRRDCAFWPRPGQPAVRGAALRDLYASVDVIIGDSCFAGTGLANYWSDRIPEMVGRGGYLIHPYVPGLEACFGLVGGRPVGEGQHLATWSAGDWDALGTEIEWALAHPERRREIALEGREHVLQFHTYERRMEALVAALARS